MTFVEVAAVASDSRRRVYVFNRGEHPIIVFTPEGEFLGSWGEGQIVRAHGLTIGPDDSVYCVDDVGHSVKKFSTDGRLLHTFANSGRPSDTGATSIDYRSIQRAAGPFNYPTDLAIAPGGDIYITDGYGNSRVHRFSPDGKLIDSWGEPGSGPGQFHVPHAIAINREGIVYVADRENSRIQLFSADGEFITAWNDIARPNGVFIDANSMVYVPELGYRAGMWPGTQPPQSNATGGRLSIFNLKGELLARWGGGENPCASGDFFAPHDAWVDARGDLYVGEVNWSGGGNKGVVPADCHCLQKFVRVK
jgi:sugar lactone lactonase YvrE